MSKRKIKEEDFDFEVKSEFDVGSFAMVDQGRRFNRAMDGPLVKLEPDGNEDEIRNEFENISLLTSPLRLPEDIGEEPEIPEILETPSMEIGSNDTSSEMLLLHREEGKKVSVKHEVKNSNMKVMKKKKQKVEEWPPGKPISYIEEIRKMMHSFGDSKHPLLTAAKVIQDIVQQQLVWIVAEAEQLARVRTGTVCIGLFELLYLVRSNPVKLARLIRYLSVMDRRVKLNTSMQVATGCSNSKNQKSELAAMELELFEVGMEEEGALSNQPVECNKANRVQQCQEFLGLMQTPQNPLVQLVQWEEQELLLLTRARRLDAFAQKLTPPDYLYFQMCRTISFLHPTGSKQAVNQAELNRFSEWISRGRSDQTKQLNLELEAWEVMNHFARETVATVVEMALEYRTKQATKKLELWHSNIPPTNSTGSLKGFLSIITHRHEYSDNNKMNTVPLLSKVVLEEKSSNGYLDSQMIPLTDNQTLASVDYDKKTTMSKTSLIEDLVTSSSSSSGPISPITSDEIHEALRRFDSKIESFGGKNSFSNYHHTRSRMLFLQKTNDDDEKEEQNGEKRIRNSRLIVPLNYSV